MSLMGFTWDVIEKDLEGLGQRHKATSRNVAHANTPGYARRNVSFEDQIRDVMESGKKLKMAMTDKGHIPTMPHKVSMVLPHEIKIVDEKYRLDGNNVDPEREMAVMAETKLQYTAMTRIAAKKVAGLRTAISGR